MSKKILGIAKYMVVALVMLLAGVVLCACDTSPAKIENINKIAVDKIECVWNVDTTGGVVKDTSGSQLSDKYIKEYDGLDFLDKVSVKNGSIVISPNDYTLMASKIAKDEPAESVTEIVEVGSYSVSLVSDTHNIYLDLPLLLTIEPKKVEWVFTTGTGTDVNTYKATYSGQDYISDISIDGLVGEDATNVEYTIINNETSEEVSELKDAGDYTVRVKEGTIPRGRYVNLFTELLTNHIDVFINAKEIAITEDMWGLDRKIVKGSDEKTYSVDYQGTSILNLINVNVYDGVEDIASRLVIKKDGNEVADIIEAGEYELTLYRDNSNYSFNNSKIYLNVNKATVDILWEGYTYDTENAINYIIYNANDNIGTIKAYYIIDGVRYDIDSYYYQYLSDGSYAGIAEVRNAGQYRISYDNTSVSVVARDASQEAIEITVIPKDIYIVAIAKTINSNDDIPANAEYRLYETYDYATATGDELTNWGETVSMLFDYYTTGATPEVVSVDAIKREVNAWQYSAGNIQKTYTISLKRNTETNYSNYNIKGVIDGVLTINLAKYTIVFRLDGRTDNQISKEYYVTQSIDATEANSRFGAVAGTREITDWYIGGRIVDLATYKVAGDVVLNKYLVYKVNYYNEAGNTIVHTDKYTMISSVTFPKYLGEDAPTKFAYTLTGWKWNTTQYPLSSSVSTGSLSSRVDIDLMPVFEINRYSIVLHYYIEDVYSDSFNILYTIDDYDNNTEFNLSDRIKQVEGYEFVGWYYKELQENGKYKYTKLSNTITLPNLFARENIGKSMTFETKYKLFECSVTLIVGNKTIKTISLEEGAKIDTKYLQSLIDKKFGYIYIMTNVPKTASGASVIVRVAEVPLLWIIIGVVVVSGILTLVIVKYVKKKKSKLDEDKLDVILNKLK